MYIRNVITAVLLLWQGATAAPIEKAPQGKDIQARSGGLITINNKSNAPRTFKIESSAETPIGDGQTPMITIPAGQSQDLPVGDKWSGAISDNAGKGTRFEFTINGWQGKSWYNTDFQFGMSDASLRPADGVGRCGGELPVAAGEKSYVTKARWGWATLDAATQQQLLSTGYVKGTAGGNLDSIYMDNAAPASIVNFLQDTAKVNAYVNPGSVAGQTQSKLAAQADLFSWCTMASHFIINAYD